MEPETNLFVLVELFGEFVLGLSAERRGLNFGHFVREDLNIYRIVKLIQNDTGGSL